MIPARDGEIACRPELLKRLDRGLGDLQHLFEIERRVTRDAAAKRWTSARAATPRSSRPVAASRLAASIASASLTRPSWWSR